jgi:predicted metal-dependent HD superfamily phosphohydrolase
MIEKIKNQQNRDTLLQFWQSLANALFESYEDFMEVFENLFKKYNQSKRYYHNTQHLISLLNRFQELRSLLNEPLAFELAIWFHDSVYEPLSQNNEIRSADLLAKLLKRANVTEKTVQKSKDLILATKSHKSNGLDYDECLFLDLDLEILSSDDQTYQLYCQAIRKEFKSVPQNLFNQKRLEVVQGFLGREKIFQTEIFANLESKARANLEAERNKLLIANN